MANCWLGRKHSDETRKKMSLYWKGRKRKPMSEETKRKIGNANRGRPVSLELRKIRSELRLGKPAPWMKGFKLWRKGNKSHTNFSGPKSCHWITDRTKLAKRQERNDMAYKDWRMNVLEKGGWKCRISNQDCFGKLVVHHILGWTDYPKLRYEVNNGIALCQAHHPRKRAEEKRLIPFFQGLVSVSNE